MAGETQKLETVEQVSVNIEKIRSLVQGYIAKVKRMYIYSCNCSVEIAINQVSEW